MATNLADICISENKKKPSNAPKMIESDAEIWRKRSSNCSVPRYQQSRILLFRSATGSEHTLPPSPPPPPPALAQRAQTNTATNNHGHNGTPPWSTLSTFSDICAADVGGGDEFSGRHSISNEEDEISAQGDDDGDDDDCKTVYSHASLLDLEEGGDMTDVDMLFARGSEFEPPQPRSSFNRSFQRAASAKKRQKPREAPRRIQQQPLVRLTSYDRTVTALGNLFRGDAHAQAATVKYLTDTSKGGSLLSATERDVVSRLLQDSMRASVASEMVGMEASTAMVIPWRGVAFHGNGNAAKVPETLMRTLILQTIGLRNLRNLNLASADSIPLSLGYAGALLVSVAALAKLGCTPSAMRSNGSVKVKLRNPKLSFGVSLKGEGPCLIRFHRPSIFNICKIDRYVSVVSRMRDLCNEFVRFVNAT